jgi:hypothetical protein
LNDIVKNENIDYTIKYIDLTKTKINKIYDIESL